MKLYRYILGIFLAVFFVAGCTGLNQETPEQFVNRFYTNIEQNNVDELMGMFDLSTLSEQEVPMLKSKLFVLIAEMSKGISAKGGLDRVEVVKQTFSEDKKSVELELLIHYKNGDSDEDSMELVKTDSGWKIS